MFLSFASLNDTEQSNVIAVWNINFQPAASVLDVSMGEDPEGDLYISR